MTVDSCRRLDARRWLAVPALVLVIALAWLKPLDVQADEHLKSGLKRALATYAVARTINGVVSVLQETGVSVQPAGIGMSFAPGQMLDPVNDLVEQFSSIMLAVCVSFGIQLALLKVGGSMLVSLALTVVLGWWAYCLWRGRSLARWQARLVVAAIVVRFAVPLVATSSEWAYQRTLAPDYSQSQKKLEATVGDVQRGAPAQDLKPPLDVTKDESWWERVGRLREWIGVDAATAQVKAKYEQIRLRLDSAVEDMVRMIAIFALQTVVLPLLFLWLLGQLVSRLATRPLQSIP